MILPDLIARNRRGEPVGIPSWCTAHPQSLAAILSTYRDDRAPILIEATCNQVNQFGGYTGMVPQAYRAFVEAIARTEKVDPGRIILGGDHLGPNPWKSEPAAAAMAKAQSMVQAYVRAGFTKIHLDCSMPCRDDASLSETEIASRAATLCAAAEAAAPSGASSPLHYVIGTEVPVPGGETTPLDGLAVTTPASVRQTLALHEQAFAARGLHGAFTRVLALVVQPGVDFGNDQVFAFDPPKAASLAATAPTLNGPLFEAHSTDYQQPAALHALVAAHFPILKVGPELTFAYRQSIVALARLETLLNPPTPSNILQILQETMQADPADWRAYIPSGPREQAMLLYGLSDRVRYYWPRPAVQQALQTLAANLAATRPEPGLVAQITGGLVGPDSPLPLSVIRRMVGAVVTKYRQATGA